MVHNPTGGGERNDAAGDGWFGASRTSKPEGHHGVDIETAPGTPVVSPIDGTIDRRGIPYKDDKSFDLVVIKGTGKFRDLEIKLLYVDRDGPVVEGGKDGIGAPVKAGTTILGNAQDVSQKEDHKDTGMKPHVHMEVYWDGERIDPARVLPLWETQKSKK